MRGIAAESCPRLVLVVAVALIIIVAVIVIVHIVVVNPYRTKHTQGHQDLAMLLLLLSDRSQCSGWTAFGSEAVRLVIGRHDGGVGISIRRSRCFGTPSRVVRR